MINNIEFIKRLQIICENYNKINYTYDNFIQNCHIFLDTYLCYKLVNYNHFIYLDLDLDINNYKIYKVFKKGQPATLFKLYDNNGDILQYKNIKNVKYVNNTNKFIKCIKKNINNNWTLHKFYTNIKFKCIKKEYILGILVIYLFKYYYYYNNIYIINLSKNGAYYKYNKNCFLINNYIGAYIIT